jgi:hypothetical protein
MNVESLDDDDLSWDDDNFIGINKKLKEEVLPAIIELDGDEKASLHL